MYTYATATINYITYTEKRQNQAPSITYVTGAADGVFLSPDLLNILVVVRDGVTTNTNIVTAFAAAAALGLGTPQNNASTVLTANITADDTTLHVSSTAGFDATGFILIGSEIIHYVSKTSTTFVADMRGFSGTAATHNGTSSPAAVLPRAIIPNGTSKSLSAADLVSLDITSGHETDTNTTVTTTALTGAVQTAIPTVQTSLPLNLAASQAVATDASGNIATSTTTAVELGYVSGVTSAVQTQLTARELLTNKDTTTSLGTSDTKYPSQKAVKTYADALPTVKVLAADPGSPTEGQVWYNTTSHLLKFYDGTTIQTVAHV